MSAELHYARNSGLRISRRVWIPTLIIGLIIGIALTRSKWSHLYSQAREAYLEQRCLRHTLPAGLVVYTSDPVEATALLARAGNYKPHIDGASYRVPQWIELTRSSWNGGGLFLHGLRNSRGRVLLAADVAGYVLVGPPGNYDRRTYVIQTRTPRGIKIRSIDLGIPEGWPGIRRELYDRPPCSSSFSHYQGLLITVPITSTIRFFAGQPDRRDVSHFTIGYEVDGSKGIIDGWLLDDDTVKLKVRDGPASAPAQ